MTPESGDRGELIDLIMRLRNASQLGTIFVDEAHVFSTESDYRSAVRKIPALASIPTCP